MDEEKKPRSDSKLDNMPESRVLELRDKLLANVKHKEILSWLAVECGVTISGSALTTFYRRHCLPLVRERRKFSAVKAEALGDAMERDPVNWDQAIVERTKQIAFEFLDSEDIDAKSVKALLDALTKANKQTLDREKFEESRRKAMAADAAKDLSENEELTPEEKVVRLKQIFRMG